MADTALFASLCEVFFMVCNVCTRWRRCLASMPILIGTVSGISGAPLANESWRRGDGVNRIIRFVAMPSQKMCTLMCTLQNGFYGFAVTYY